MMTADGIRTLYDYHFALNRRVWDRCVMSLDAARFTEELGYSLGSIRNQVVHVASVDMRWLARLRGAPVPPALEASEVARRPAGGARAVPAKDPATLARRSSPPAATRPPPAQGSVRPPVRHAPGTRWPSRRPRPGGSPRASRD